MHSPPLANFLCVAQLAPLEILTDPTIVPREVKEIFFSVGLNEKNGKKTGHSKYSPFWLWPFAYRTK